MKNLCRNYLSGSCRYGDRCRFIHPKTTSLLDPPSWIYTNVYNNPTNLNCLEISTDEVRYSLLINDTRKILDDIWFDNYSKMYKSLNEICRVGVGRSTSNRVIDLRSKPEVFNLPFDLGRVEQKIVELRKNYPVMGENDVMKGEEEEEGQVKEGVPKFVKEYQEKSVSQNRDYYRDYSGNRDGSNRDYSRDRDRDSRPYSFRQPDNRYPPRDQYSRDQQYRGGSFNRDASRGDFNRDVSRGDFNRDSSRDSRGDQYPRDANRDQYSREGNKDHPTYRDQYPRDGNRDQYPRDANRDQYPRDGNRDKPPSYNPPFRQDSYNKPLSYPRSPQRPSQPPTYPPTQRTQSSPYSRTSQSPTYSRPSQRPPYPPSQPKKEEEDLDFEYKNIPYNFDRK